MVQVRVVTLLRAQQLVLEDDDRLRLELQLLPGSARHGPVEQAEERRGRERRRCRRRQPLRAVGVGAAAHKRGNLGAGERADDEAVADAATLELVVGDHLGGGAEVARALGLDAEAGNDVAVVVDLGALY